MKVIISHDVDHVSVIEHKKDLIIPKFWIRSLIEFSLGYISYSEIRGRLSDFFHNKWHNLEELMKFDKEKDIPSIFSIGVSKGRGLSYSLRDAKFWIKKILGEGFKVGVHGIAFESYADIKLEYETFKKISGLDRFGIRMHYLKANNETFEMFDKVGYIYDSSVYDLKNPFKIGNLWEFPLCLMDGYIVNRNSHYQNQNLKQIKETTKEMIEEAFKKNLKYFTFLFHDRYFSNSFKSWKDWYIWVIEHLKSNGFEFINYREAIEELENKK
jgi:hypothetical protein